MELIEKVVCVACGGSGVEGSLNRQWELGRYRDQLDNVGNECRLCVGKGHLPWLFREHDICPNTANAYVVPHIIAGVIAQGWEKPNDRRENFALLPQGHWCSQHRKSVHLATVRAELYFPIARGIFEIEDRVYSAMDDAELDRWFGAEEEDYGEGVLTVRHFINRGGPPCQWQVSQRLSQSIYHSIWLWTAEVAAGLSVLPLGASKPPSIADNAGWSADEIDQIEAWDREYKKLLRDNSSGHQD